MQTDVGTPWAPVRAARRGTAAAGPSANDVIGVPR